MIKATKYSSAFLTLTELFMEQKTQVRKPLEGILVVSIEQALAAPLCSCRLADAGARVIKIERDSGDFARGYDSAVNGESSYFIWTNRGKESMVLDIKSKQGLTVLHKMLAKADIFIQNLAPGATSRLGLNSSTLSDLYPHLITCNISGYGDKGEYKDMKAYDLLIQAESGLVSVSGSAESYGRIGVSICDIGAGMNALSGILLALAKREKTGVGSTVNVSLFDGAADWMTVPILHQKYTGKGPKRVGLNHPSISPYGEYLCADDKSLVISIQNDREWQSFCEKILKKPLLVFDDKYKNNNLRVKNKHSLNQIINQCFGLLDQAKLSQQLSAAGIAYGLVNHTEDLIHHPQLRYTKIKTAAGIAEIVAPPVIFDDEDIELGAVPSLGEHTNELLLEFSDNYLEGEK